MKKNIFEEKVQILDKDGNVLQEGKTEPMFDWCLNNAHVARFVKRPGKVARDIDTWCIELDEAEGM